MHTGGGRDAATAEADRPIASDRVPPLRALLLIAGIALALRVLFLLLLRSQAPELVDHPVLDGAHYHNWALDIVHDRGLAKRVFFMHPVYPHFIALIYWATGPQPLAVALAQCLLGTLSAVLVTLIAWRLIGSVAWALVAGLFLATYRPLIVHDSLLETTSLSVVLMLASLLLVLGRARAHLAITAGAVYALATLCRGNLVACLPVVLIYPIWRKGIRDRGAWRFSLLLLLGFVGIYQAAGLRNYLVAGQWAAGTTNLGPTLYLSHHRGATTGGQQPPPFVRPDPRHELDDYRREALRRTGRQMSAAEHSRYWTNQAIAEILADPGHAIELLGRKLVLSIGAGELSDNYSQAYLDQLTGFSGLPLPGFGLIFGLGLLGALVSLRDKRLQLAHGMVVLYLLSLCMLYVSSRFRMPLTPWLILLASCGARFLWQKLTRRSWLALGLGATVMLAAVAASELSASAVPDLTERSQALNSHGLVALETGQTAKGLALLQEAQRLEPDNADIWINLGRVYHATGALREMARAFGQAARLRPESAAAHSGVGVAQAAQGRIAAAERAFRRALLAAPDDVDARFNLAMLLARSGQSADAAREFERLLVHAPAHMGARLGLALSLATLDPAKSKVLLKEVQQQASAPRLREAARQALQSIHGGPSTR